MLQLIPSNPNRAPILFVHGAWGSADYWRPNFMPYFAEKGYPTYAINLSKHNGASGRTSLNFTRMRDYVADVEKAIEQIRELPILVGHSMGGLVLQKYMEKGGTAKGVSLLCSIPHTGAFAQFNRTFLQQPIDFLVANLTFQSHRVVNSPKKLKRMFYSDNASDEIVALSLKQLQPESYLAILLDLMFPRIRKFNPNKIPLQIVAAEEDRFFLQKEARALGEAYQTPVEWLHKMPHHVPLAPDWQIAADKIYHWMELLE